MGIKLYIVFEKELIWCTKVWICYSEYTLRLFTSTFALDTASAVATAAFAVILTAGYYDEISKIPYSTRKDLKEIFKIR